MAAVAEKTDPALWEKVKAKVTEGDKGGHPGQWSARKAQMAVQEYKKAGGGYKGRKTADNHLAEWTHEDWGTKSGANSGETGERYMPKEALETVTDAEYRRSTAKKRADTAKGRQFSAQPADVAKKTAEVRHAHEAQANDAELAERSRADLLEAARAVGVTGRSRMRKDELVRALANSQR